MLLTDLRKDFARTHVTDFDGTAAPDVAAIFAEMEREAADAYAGEDVADEEIVLERSVDLRYAGQEHTVNTPGPHGDVDGDAVAATIERFHERHERAYNFRMDDPVEVVNLRLTASAPMPEPDVDVVERDGDVAAAVKETREVDFGTEEVYDTRVYERSALPTTEPIEGPAVVEEPACTTLVHPGQTVDVDVLGNLHIS